MATYDFKVGKGVVAQNASTFTTGSFTGQITSTLATGTSPFSITSTTVNTNLNADMLDGNHASAFLTIAALGTGVQTALGTAVGSAGAFVTFNGALGTPSSGTLTYATGLPVSTGISGLGANVATFLATPSSANLAAAVTDETGSGSLVFGTTPALTSPAISTSITTPSTTFALINTTATTVNFAGAATTLSIGAGSGTTTINNDLTVTGALTVNGTVTTVNSTTITVDDKNLELGSVGTPTDTTADGGGITLKGATDKTFNWVNSSSSWTSSENIDLATGKVLKIAGTQVLSASQYTGNAATVTNGVYTTGTYSNPTWLTGLAWSKISSTPTTLSGYGITDAATSTHVHGNITNAGAIGSTSGLMVITGASGVLTTLAAGTTSQWLRGDGTYTAVTLGNSQVIKFDTGTTEGTDLYTFNGSAAKTIDIKAGSNITLTKAAGAITIAAAAGFTNPMTTAGDLIYGGVSGAATRLGANSTGTKQFLSSISSGNPTWSAVSASDVGLGSVENTALSTWAGTTNIVTVGAVTVDSGAKLDYNTVTISANTATTIHSFSGGTYRSAKFLVQLTQGTKFRVSEVLVLHDGTTAYAAEYGIMEVGSMTGVAVDAVYSAGTINLQTTVTDAATTNVVAKVLEIAIVA